MGFIPELSGFTRQYNKKSETATTDRELYTKKVGRFMYSASALGNFEASTDQIENFHNEDLRWASASIENIIANSRSDYTFFLTSSNANYNSIQSILSTNDLQQVYSGSLRYPSGDYSGVTLPNSVNYTNAAANTANGSGDRFYYRAFKLPSFSEGTLRFRLKVFGKFTQSDIFALGLNNSNIRIDIRLPGPFNDPFDNLGNGATEGSFYGVVNNQFSGIDTTGGSNGNVPWCAYISRNLTSTDPTLNDGIEFVVSTREVFVFNTDGVIIVKIRYKSGFTGYISKIQILNN